MGRKLEITEVDYSPSDNKKDPKYLYLRLNFARTYHRVKYEETKTIEGILGTLNKLFPRCRRFITFGNITFKDEHGREFDLREWKYFIDEEERVVVLFNNVVISDGRIYEVRSPLVKKYVDWIR